MYGGFSLVISSLQVNLWSKALDVEVTTRFATIIIKTSLTNTTSAIITLILLACFTVASVAYILEEIDSFRKLRIQ